MEYKKDLIAISVVIMAIVLTVMGIKNMLVIGPALTKKNFLMA